MSARLQPETRAALLTAMVEIEALQASESDPEVHGLLERARHDVERGWHEAAHDALWRARRLLQTCTEGNPR